MQDLKELSTAYFLNMISTWHQHNLKKLSSPASMLGTRNKAEEQSQCVYIRRPLGTKFAASCKIRASQQARRQMTLQPSFAKRHQTVEILSHPLITTPIASVNPPAHPGAYGNRESGWPARRSWEGNASQLACARGHRPPLCIHLFIPKLPSAQPRL